MVKAIFGKKIGMTQYFSENGSLIPITVILVEPCVVIQIKTVARDGYSALVVSFGNKRKTNKSISGQLSKAETSNKRYLKEIRTAKAEEFKIGDIINASIFSPGDIVDVTGTSKGKGYAGTIKRWGHCRGPMGHGSGYHRGAGSMGAHSEPARVYKGKKLPGHMGHKKVTVQNLKITWVDVDKEIIAVVGAIVGPNKGIVFIKNAIKKSQEGN